MNYIYGNGEAQPYNEKAESLNFNEMKSKAFIRAKHVIQSATPNKWESVCRFIGLYSLLTSTESLADIQEIKQMLVNKQKQLFGV